MKFKEEEHIKKYLEGRLIHPSEGLWDQLDRQLERRSERKRRRIFLSLAAVLLLGLLIGGIFPKTGLKTDTPKAVKVVKQSDLNIEDPENTEKALPTFPQIQSVVLTESVLQQETGQEKKTTPVYKQNGKAGDIAVKPNPENNPENHQHAVVSVTAEELTPLQEEQLANTEVPFTDLDQETEERLRAAMLGKAIAEPDETGALANELLKQVDREEDIAYRNKVREIIKEGWFKAKNTIVTTLSK